MYSGGVWYPQFNSHLLLFSLRQRVHAAEQGVGVKKSQIGENSIWKAH